jgi:hypothetical protein
MNSKVLNLGQKNQINFFRFLKNTLEKGPDFPNQALFMLRVTDLNHFDDVVIFLTFLNQ